MKKVTRLLILTAFVFPIFTVSRAYAGAPRPGHGGISAGERERLGIDPIMTSDPYTRDPFKLENPIGGNVPDLSRDGLLGRDPFAGRDAYPLSGHDGWDTGTSSTGGGTAPLDGGISLLIAAGLGLGIKRARNRKKAAEQKDVEISE